MAGVTVLVAFKVANACVRNVLLYPEEGYNFSGLASTIIFSQTWQSDMI